ncbi:MAG: hypothetical protein P8Y23_07920, partial [Candidatus Lokiarchaeota archaeon]
KRFRNRIKREKKPAKERVKDFLFLLPAYLALIVFVFIPIAFSVMISFFKNPTASVKSSSNLPIIQQLLITILVI